MSTGPIRVVMPRLGESIVEGTLVRWRVAAGDVVQRGDILAEVETDKATSEIPSPTDGVVTSILCEAGRTVDVGTELAVIDGKPAPQKIQIPAAPEPALKRAAPTERLPTHRLASRPVNAAGGPIRSSPAVRRLARSHGVDIHQVTGSGKGGRVTREDILKTIEAQKAPAKVSAPVARAMPPSATPPSTFRVPKYRPGPQDREIPFSRRRTQIAEHMLYSLGTSAHVASVAEIDMSAVQRAKRIDSTAAEQQGLKITLMPYIVSAVCRALIDYPELNATVRDQTLVLRGDRNIGIAVDTKDGLVVPVIHRADDLGLMGLTRALDTLAKRARSGSLTPEDVSGGSFTISNPGRDGNLFGISIIRQPEVGILRIGSIVKRPVVRTVEDEDVIVVRPILYAALSYDHRVIDGRTGNGFLKRFTDLLTDTRPYTAD